MIIVIGALFKKGTAMDGMVIMLITQLVRLLFNAIPNSFMYSSSEGDGSQSNNMSKEYEQANDHWFS